MLFINVFTLIITVSIAAEEPSVVHAKVVLHKSSALVWFWLVRAYFSNAAFSSWCLNVPFASNLSRICYEVMPRQWCRTGCLRSVGTKRHNTALETRTVFTTGRKRLDGLLSLESQSWLTLATRRVLPESSPLEIIIDLPFGFPINNIISLSPHTVSLDAFSHCGIMHHFCSNCHV